MQVLEPTVCQLSNFEAYTSLEEWRAHRRKQQILPSEAVFEHEKNLLKCDAMRSERSLSRDRAVMFLKALRNVCNRFTTVDGESFELSEAEKIQILNLKPTSIIVLENIIEGLASQERMASHDVAVFASSLADIVTKYLLRQKRRQRIDNDVYCTDSDDDAQAIAEDEEDADLLEHLVDVPPTGRKPPAQASPSTGAGAIMDLDELALPAGLQSDKPYAVATAPQPAAGFPAETTDPATAPGQGQAVAQLGSNLSALQVPPTAAEPVSPSARSSGSAKKPPKKPAKKKKEP